MRVCAAIKKLLNSFIFIHESKLSRNKCNNQLVEGVNKTIQQHWIVHKDTRKSLTKSVEYDRGWDQFLLYFVK